MLRKVRDKKKWANHKYSVTQGQAVVHVPGNKFGAGLNRRGLAEFFLCLFGWDTKFPKLSTAPQIRSHAGVGEERLCGPGQAHGLLATSDLPQPQCLHARHTNGLQLPCPITAAPRTQRCLAGVGLPLAPQKDNYVTSQDLMGSRVAYILMISHEKRDWHMPVMN